MEPTKRKQNGTCCSAYGCSRKFNKNDNIRFHSFPLKDKQLLKKWLAAMRRDDFLPTQHSRICGQHFLPTDYYYPGSPMLQKTAVPTLFNFPVHLQKDVTKRTKIIKTTIPTTYY